MAAEQVPSRRVGRVSSRGRSGIVCVGAPPAGPRPRPKRGGEGGLAVTDEERDVSSRRRRLAAALASPFLHAAALTAGGLFLVARWQLCNAFAVNVSRGDTSWSWLTVV
jgi:hypothetical protein